ncbi:adhesion G-protein coupled receptor G5 isoform X2 [Antechinus flavipes]|uniref:adhesion G-protein coupled receptor G5 isoform X2 n=1 Tax=Antechinus flavipes TaxID=38775 RepID=UPI002235D2F9|nr:adhesion G-protein coupled receptor G5 isoform X2 [Antechinus flavipes]
MVFPKWPFLFLCLLTGWGWTNEVPNRTTSEIVAYMERLEILPFSRRTQNSQRSIHLLEDMLNHVILPSVNITLQTNSIQSLVFKLTCNFSGLIIKDSYLQKATTRHVMQFPAELTQQACAERNTSLELRLICIYFDQKYYFQDDNNSLLLNNNILGAILMNYSVSNLKQNINISFWHNESLATYDLTCVFWKEGAGKASWGAWSIEGCKTVEVTPYKVLCQCDHLTYFAVLMKLSSSKISVELLDPLTYISIVGCSLSIVASLLTILLHFYSRGPSTSHFKKKRDSTTYIHINLHVSVILLNVTFLLSPSLVFQPIGCVAMAALLHYSLLSCLTWMAIEGFNLYLLFVRVYNIYIRKYILKLCALGWGFPAIIVIFLLLLKRSAYGHYTIPIKTSLENDTNFQNVSMCWIKSVAIHRVFVMGYAGVASLFNLVILIWTVKMLCGLRSREKKWKSRTCQDFTTVLGLSMLLGITWNLAFFSFQEFLVPQLFLFTIFNSFYGFFLFLWFCAQKRHSDLEAEISSSSQIRTGLPNHNSPFRAVQPSSVTCLSSLHGISHQEGEVKKNMGHKEVQPFMPSTIGFPGKQETAKILSPHSEN